MHTESKGVRICNLVKVYGGQRDGEPVKAVDHISVDIRPGEFVTLLGPSGCGSTCGPKSAKSSRSWGLRPSM